MGDGLTAPISGEGRLPPAQRGGHWEEIHQIDRSLKLRGEREKQNQSMNLLGVCVCERERIVCSVCGREVRGREKICGTKSSSGSMRPNSL